MRVTLRSLAAVAALVAVAACGDTPSAPQSASSLAPSNRAPSFDLSNRGGFGDQSSTFTLTAKGGTFTVGAGLFQVSFPAGSVCDPSLTQDVESQWNRDCVTLGRNVKVKVTATVRVGAGGVAVDFEPGLRFAPNSGVTISTDVFAPVLLSNRGYFAQHPSALGSLAMYYVPSLGSARIADYVSDPSLVTHVDLKTGRVWRRVTHFSGYSITSGEACDPSPSNPDCVDDGRGI
jgi:hypothetical protein